MISVTGAKIVKIDLEFDEKVKVSGTYHLMSSADTVLAKQNFGSYGLDYAPSGEVVRLVNELRAQVRKDINQTMGIQNV